MSDTKVQAAPAQPAPPAQTSAENKGGTNTKESDFAKMLMAKANARAIEATSEAATKPAEATAETETAPEQKTETEIAKNNSAEAETEGDAEAQADTESEDKAEEVLSPETPSLDPKLQAKIERRIGKEVAKRKALEAEVASLKALVSQPPQVEEKEVVIHAPANVPLADIKNHAELEQLKQTARTETRWAESWLDEDIPPEGIVTDRGHVTKKQLKELIRNARIVQEDLIPQREKFLNTRQTAAQQAAEEFPFLSDPAHPGYQLAQQAKRENRDWLAGLPNADWVVGVQVEGILAMRARKGAKEASAEKPAAKSRPKPTSGQAEVGSDASTTRVPVGVMDKLALDGEKKALAGKKGVTAKEYAASLVRQSQFRNSR